MGMVIIHGDLIERIATITTTEGLEYKLTTAIQKLNNKISALLRLQDKIQIKLYLSSSLYQMAPYIGLQGLSQISAEVEKIVQDLRVQCLGHKTWRCAHHAVRAEYALRDGGRLPGFNRDDPDFGVMSL